MGDGVFGALVARLSSRQGTLGREIFRHFGDGPLECLQLVSGAVAPVVLGASAAGLRSDDRPRGCLQGDWRGAQEPGKSDVSLVAPSARWDAEPVEFPHLYDAGAKGGRKDA